jgi:hypothetical protein
MTRTLSFTFAVLIGLGFSVIPAEAQYRTVADITGSVLYRGNTYNRPLSRSVYGGGYGYYDPATLQQMLNLPEALASCQVDLSTSKVSSCRPVIKTADALLAYSQNPDGILGTIHVDRNKFHFRPFDDTNRRIGRAGAITIGTAGGATGGAIIGGTLGDRKGAVIGGAAGAGIGALAGWWSSRNSHNHDNCLHIEPSTAQSAGLQPQGATATVATSTVTVGTSTSTGGRFEIENTTRLHVDVFDGSTYLGTLKPAGQEGSVFIVDQPRSRYRGVALLPNRQGGMSKDDVNIQVKDNGWMFVEPTFGG